MRILFIISQIPYPWWFYGRSGYYFLLKSLSKYLDIHVSFPAIDIRDDNLTHLRNKGMNVYPFNLDTRDKYYKIILNLLEKKPFKIKKYWSESYKKFLVELVYSIKPDIIQIHTPHMAQYGLELEKIFPDIPIVLRIHDIAIDLIKTYILNNKNLLKRFVAYWQLKKTEKYEVSIWNSFEKTIFITKKDKENATIYSQNYGFNPGDKFTLIMDGISIKSNLYIQTKKKEHSLVFAASDQIQNIESLNWFLRKIWFHIFDKTHFKLNIYGKICQYFEKDKETLKLRKVFLKGFLEDRNELDFELAKNSIFLSPTIVGSGIRTKILEAGSIGMPVLCTTFDFEPFSDYFQPGKHILVADNKDKFLKILREVENGIISLQEISQSFYSKLKEEFGWDITAKKFLNLYNQLLDSK